MKALEGELAKKLKQQQPDKLKEYLLTNAPTIVIIDGKEYILHSKKNLV